MTDVLKKAIEDLGRDWKEFQDTVRAEVKAMKDDRGTGEITEKIEKINTAITDSQKAVDKANAESKVLKDRIDQLELERDRIGPAGQKTAEALQQKHLQAFNRWLRAKGKDPVATADLQKVEQEVLQARAAQEGKAANVSTTSASGGYMIPEILVQPMFDQARLLSPLRQECRVIQAANSDIRLIVNKHGASTGWVGEAGSRTATVTPDLRERVPTFGTLYAYVSATEESLNDIAFDVGAWLQAEISAEMAIAEATAFLTGNGTNRPTGMLNSAPVSTDDGASPERGAGVLEYLPMAVGTSPMGTIISTGIFDLVYGLRAEYRQRAKFTMNSATIGHVRKLRDTTGQFLWQPSLQAGQPSTLVGYPVVTIEALANIAVNAYPILFGDFMSGYVIVDLAGGGTTIDNNITAPGYVKWYVRRRLGGCILDNYAIKVGKCSIS